MAYKYFKYFILLLTCLCCTGVLSAQTDSSDSYASDTAVTGVDTSVENNTTGLNDGDNSSKSALDKFSARQPQGTVAERQLPASSVQRIKDDKDFWYRDKEVGKEKPEEQKQSFLSRLLSSHLFRVIFWVLIVAAALGIIVIYLLNGGGWIFAPRGKKIRAGTRPVAAEADNIFTIDFEASISQALSESNYRLATRLLFLRLLRKMSEQNIIQYSIDKTNMDYMFELGNTAYFKDFAHASRAYEYVWYGNFDVQQNQFSYIRQRLDEFNQKLST